MHCATDWWRGECFMELIIRGNCGWFNWDLMLCHARRCPPQITGYVRDMQSGVWLSIIQFITNPIMTHPDFLFWLLHAKVVPKSRPCNPALDITY
jgi:hypothetical protein